MHNVSKILFTLCLTIFIVAGNPTISCAQETKVGKNGRPAEPVSDSIYSPSKHQVRVFYFYFLPRCYACEMIEVLTETTVKENFKEEVKNGALTYQAIDIGKKENQHYEKDYRLLTKSVIISDVIDGKEKRWKNCDRIWFLYENEERFIAYISGEINRYLE